MSWAAQSNRLHAMLWYYIDHGAVSNYRKLLTSLSEVTLLWLIHDALTTQTLEEILWVDAITPTMLPQAVINLLYQEASAELVTQLLDQDIPGSLYVYTKNPAFNNWTGRRFQQTLSLAEVTQLLTSPTNAAPITELREFFPLPQDGTLSDAEISALLATGTASILVLLQTELIPIPHFLAAFEALPNETARLDYLAMLLPNITQFLSYPEILTAWTYYLQFFVLYPPILHMLQQHSADPTVRFIRHNSLGLHLSFFGTFDIVLHHSNLYVHSQVQHATALFTLRVRTIQSPEITTAATVIPDVYAIPSELIAMLRVTHRLPVATLSDAYLADYAAEDFPEELMLDLELDSEVTPAADWKSCYQDILSRFTPDMINTIRFYTHQGDRIMHAYLRGTALETRLETVRVQHDVLQNIAWLNTVIWEASHQAQLCADLQPLVLYRGFMHQGGPYSPGSIIKNQSNKFVSFTSDINVAYDFGAILYRLEIAPTDRYRIVLPISDLQIHEAYLSKNFGEEEFLLPLGTEFIISDNISLYRERLVIPLKIYRQSEVDVQHMLDPEPDLESGTLFHAA